MDIDEKKKVLFVIGMEHKMEHLIKQTSNINLGNFLILQSYGPVILPFGDLMRDNNRCYCNNEADGKPHIVKLLAARTYGAFF